MTIEEQKAALDKVSEEIKTKLNTATEGIARGEKATSQVKDDLTGLLDKQKEHTDQLTKDLEEANTRVADMETKLERIGDSPQKAETFGEVMTKAFEASFKEKGRVQGIFNFDGLDTKAIMLQSTLVNDVIQPDRVPGIITPLERNRHIRPYFAQGQTSSSQVDYIEETANTDGTASVAEGVAYAQSDLVLTQQTAGVKKVGAHVVISKEMLEDIPGLMSYVQGRLIAKYNQYEDEELISGGGTGTDLKGVATSAVAWADPGIIANGNAFDVLRAGVKQAQVAEYFPNVIFVNPAELFLMDVAKDSNGNYLLPYIFNGQGHNISGIPIIPTTAIAADNFLIGDFARGAQIFDRRQLQLEVASENSDDFLKDLVTAKLSTRLALPIYRQSVFIKGVMSTSITGLAT